MSSIKWIIPTALFFVALGVHIYQVPPTPIEEAVEETVGEVFFGGVLSNNTVATTTTETTNSATNISSPGLVWTSDTHGYIFYEAAIGGLWMSSTTDSGATWSTGRNVDSVNPTDVVSYGVWWEGWTPGTTTTRYIHIVTTDLGVDDTYYTRLDTQTGAFTATQLTTTQTAACAEGASCYTTINMTASGTLAVMATNGSDTWSVFCFKYLACTTAWTEYFGGSPAAGNDWNIFLPIPGTDNTMNLLLDDSADNATFSVFSGTSTSWWGARTFTSTIDQNTTYDSQLLGATLSTTTGIIYAAFVDDANDYVTADHDIQVWTYSTTTWSWTQRTNCVQNNALIGVKLAYDEPNQKLYCVFGMRTTIDTATTGGIYFKTSTDGGTTWSATSTMVNDNADDINGMTVNIVGDQRIGVTWNYTTAPRADQQFYDDIADLIADGGGGGGTPSATNATIIWYD